MRILKNTKILLKCVGCVFFANLFVGSIATPVTLLAITHKQYKDYVNNSEFYKEKKAEAIEYAEQKYLDNKGNTNPLTFKDEAFEQFKKDMDYINKSKEFAYSIMQQDTNNPKVYKEIRKYDNACLGTGLAMLPIGIGSIFTAWKLAIDIDNQKQEKEEKTK